MWYKQAPWTNLKERNWNDTHTHIHRDIHTLTIESLTHTFHDTDTQRLINSWLIRLSVDNVLLTNTRRLPIVIDKSIPLYIGIPIVNYLQLTGGSRSSSSPSIQGSAHEITVYVKSFPSPNPVVFWNHTWSDALNQGQYRPNLTGDWWYTTTRSHRGRNGTTYEAEFDSSPDRCVFRVLHVSPVHNGRKHEFCSSILPLMSSYMSLFRRSHRFRNLCVLSEGHPTVTLKTNTW